MKTDESGNLGNVDRAFRAIAGAALLGLCFIGHGTLWPLVGVIPLVTGIAGECPLYRALGISTRPITSARRAEAS